MTTVFRGERSTLSTIRSRALPWAAGLLAVGAVAAPLAFGATQVWAYCALQILVAIATVLWILSPSDGRPRRLWLPLAVAALGVMQVIPLPASQIRWLAPYCAEARETAAEFTGSPGRGGVSVNTAETLAALRRCVTLALVVVMAADICRGERERRVLVGSIAAAGTLVLVLGLVIGSGPKGKALGFHDMRGYWKFYKNPLLTGFHSIGMGAPDVVTVGGIHYVSDSPICGTAVGALINANHFAVCVGLTAPLVVCLLLSGSISRVRDPRVRLFLGAGYTALAVYAFVVPAHARAGLVALGLAVLSIALLAPARTKSRALFAMFGMAALALGAALVSQKLGLIPRLEGRAFTWKAALEMFQKSPWLGVGLGNYETVYPALQQGPVAYFAHSAWLEWAAEAGLVGLSLLAVAIALGIRSVGRIWDWHVPSARRLVRLGVVGGILFAALHGAVDHGIQIPANAYLCALLIGVLLGDVHSDRPARASFAATGHFGTGIPLCKLVTVAIACLLIWGAGREWSADRLVFPLRQAIVVQRAPGDEQRLAEKPELLQAALPAAQRAFAMAPRNAAFAETIGQAFLHLSRGERGPELEAAQDWFRRSLRISPVNPWIRQTLTEINARLQDAPQKQ